MPSLSLEEWDGEGGSRGRAHKVYLWLIHVDVWQKPTQYYKAIILSIKNKSIKKRNGVVKEGNGVKRWEDIRYL